ncbi:MAG: hypothetical protein AAGG11_07460 [Pseudomonadota bacterium]
MTIGVPLLTGARDELIDRWLELSAGCDAQKPVLIACRAARYRLLRDFLLSHDADPRAERRVLPIENPDDLDYFLRLAECLHVDRFAELERLKSHPGFAFPLALRLLPGSGAAAAS